MESKEGRGGGGVLLVGRAEIDMRAPFRSVKEAVLLFGEKVLAEEVFGHRLVEMRAAAERRHDVGLSRLGSIAAELEETRQNLERAREESFEMANCLSSLRKELERTRRELTQLKTQGPEKQPVDSEIEDLKFVENTAKAEIETAMNTDAAEFQKRRCVTFAHPPSLAQVINPESQALERQFSVDKEAMPMKKKKKPLIPLIGGLFGKKKSNKEAMAPKPQIY